MRHHHQQQQQQQQGGHHEAMMNADRHSESSDGVYDVGVGGVGGCGQSSTLTPMHLRKAKLMFFWCRYPSSSVLKTFFPDVKFNKNNTAQLVKWFSNFRSVLFHFRSTSAPLPLPQKPPKSPNELLKFRTISLTSGLASKLNYFRSTIVLKIPKFHPK